MLISCLHSSFITLWPLPLPVPRWARWGMGVTYTPVLWYTAGAYSIPMTFTSSHPELPLRTHPLNRIRVRLGPQKFTGAASWGGSPGPSPGQAGAAISIPRGELLPLPTSMLTSPDPLPPPPQGKTQTACVGQKVESKPPPTKCHQESHRGTGMGRQTEAEEDGNVSRRSQKSSAMSSSPLRTHHSVPSVHLCRPH